MGECELFDDFGYIIQGMLAGICFIALCFKRYREHPRRRWKIFGLDVSKQAFSASVAHMFNLGIATLFSEQNDYNPCTWYFINIMVDTTLGVLIAYVLLAIVQTVVVKHNIEQLKTGHYTIGDTAKIDIKAWLAQLLVWNLITVIMKSILVAAMFLLAEGLNKIGEYILSGIEEHPKFELVVVMIITPGIMNIFQFWVQDNFLKEDIIEQRNLLGLEKGINLAQPAPAAASAPKASSSD